MKLGEWLLIGAAVVVAWFLFFRKSAGPVVAGADPLASVVVSPVPHNGPPVTVTINTTPAIGNANFGSQIVAPPVTLSTSAVDPYVTAWSAPPTAVIPSPPPIAIAPYAVVQIAPGFPQVPAAPPTTQAPAAPPMPAFAPAPLLPTLVPTAVPCPSSATQTGYNPDTSQVRGNACRDNVTGAVSYGGWN